METAKEFVKGHFKGIENQTWFPAIVAIAEGFSLQQNKVLIKENERLVDAMERIKNAVAMSDKIIVENDLITIREFITFTLETISSKKLNEQENK